MNALLLQAGLSDRFVTLASGLLNPESHRVTFVNAGHLSPLVFRQATGQFEEAVPRDVAGFPLGVVEDHVYQACQVTLAPGDSILSFTDGVTEAKNRQDKEFQMAGVEAALRGGPFAPDEIGEKIVKAVEQHSLGCKQHDDLTVVCFGRRGS
jgi:serine phosphatase RsbU (regulator of sigma subunit)